MQCGGGASVFFCRHVDMTRWANSVPTKPLPLDGQELADAGDPLLSADVMLAFSGLPQRHTPAESQQWWHPSAVVNAELEASLQRLIRGKL